MQNSPAPFVFENHSVRTVIVNDEVWFVAKDIALALEYPSSSIATINKLVGHVPNEWKGRNQIPTPGGTQRLLCLSEQGMYFFINRSDKPKALPFQKWVAGEVLPQIRKTGQYQVATNLTIGKPGHKCLSDLIEGKTSHLMGKAKVSAKSRLWAQVRKAYGVDVAADIPADQLDSARQFVGSYVLEGDYLPADQKQLPLQDEAPEYHYQEFGKTFHDGQLIIKELKKYVPQDAHMLLRQLDAVLVSGWTVMDESLMRLNMTRSMLSKWRGEAMGHIKHRL
ncbi:MAG: hypothetical protein CMH98_08770 [Oceanospirillaceae bacterium]|nr:hypothetical protein [Oceanospirillaceae bacterium]